MKVTIEQVVATIDQKILPVSPKNLSVLNDPDPLITLRVDRVVMRRLIEEGFTDYIYAQPIEVEGHKFHTYCLRVPLSQLKKLG